MVLMRGHNTFSLRNKIKISLNYPQYTLLSGALPYYRCFIAIVAITAEPGQTDKAFFYQNCCANFVSDIL